VRFWRSRSDPAPEDGLRLVVGLGNPGARYAETRHNAGYMVAQRLAERRGGRFKGSRHRADFARVEVDGLPVLLALPLTYMNESGNAVSRLVEYYRIPIENLLIVADEIDLPFGTLRLRPEGSSSGNRGLQSVIGALGTDQFARLRVGVGRPERHAVEHVLGTFDPGQRKVLPALIDKAADAAASALVQGVPAAMNQYNKDWLPELDSGGTIS
jgi:PTH1 family peptidyl-tRNA hydrolase